MNWLRLCVMPRLCAGQQGLTGIHDFDGRLCFQALQTLNLNDELGLRFIKNVPVYRIEAAVGVQVLRSGFGNDFLRVGGMKIFADGALGLRTATMVAPYEGESRQLWYCCHRQRGDVGAQ